MSPNPQRPRRRNPARPPALSKAYFMKRRSEIVRRLLDDWARQPTRDHRVEEEIILDAFGALDDIYDELTGHSFAPSPAQLAAIQNFSPEGE